MRNQELQEELETLKKLLKVEEADVEIRERWVKESKAKARAIKDRIENIEAVLQEVSE